MQKLSGGDKDWSRSACDGVSGCLYDAGNGQRTNCKPHVLEAESLYGIQQGKAVKRGGITDEPSSRSI